MQLEDVRWFTREEVTAAVKVYDGYAPGTDTAGAPLLSLTCVFIMAVPRKFEDSANLQEGLFEARRGYCFGTKRPQLAYDLNTNQSIGEHAQRLMLLRHLLQNPCICWIVWSSGKCHILVFSLSSGVQTNPHFNRQPIIFSLAQSHMACLICKDMWYTAIALSTFYCTVQRL